MKWKTLDVRPLLEQGEEPYPEIRRRVDALASGEGLRVIAPFLPSPLIERLRSEGLACRSEHRADGAWNTHFWRE